MEQSVQRKTMLVTIALVAGALVLFAIYIGVSRLADEARISSLAFQIPASDTIYFLRTTDRALLERQINTVTVPVNVVVPDGTMYEFAVLQNGSGSSWIINIMQGEEEKHIVLTSQDNPTTVLPAQDTRLSLGKIPLIKSNIGTQDTEYTWISSTSLQQYSSIVGSLLRTAVHPDSSGILVLFSKVGHGSAIVSAPRTSAYAPIQTTSSLEPAPRFSLEVGDPTSAIQSLQKHLSTENGNLLEGLNGIIAYKQQEITGSTDLAKILTDLMAGPMHIVVTDSGSLALEGTARSAEVYRLWLEGIASKQDMSMKRELSFMKNENVRIDIAAVSGSTLQYIGDYKGWQQRRISENIFAAQKEKQYILAANLALTELLIDAREAPKNDSGQLPSAQGTIDVSWLFNALEETVPELANGIREDLSLFMGRLPTNISWSIRPVRLGWLIEWTEE